jgi:hypothetical protein
VNNMANCRLTTPSSALPIKMNYVPLVGMVVLTPIPFLSIRLMQGYLPSHDRNTEGNKSCPRSTCWTMLRFALSLLEKWNAHHGPHSGKTPNLFIFFWQGPKNSTTCRLVMDFGVRRLVHKGLMTAPTKIERGTANDDRTSAQDHDTRALRA